MSSGCVNRSLKEGYHHESSKHFHEPKSFILSYNSLCVPLLSVELSSAGVVVVSTFSTGIPVTIKLAANKIVKVSAINFSMLVTKFQHFLSLH